MKVADVNITDNFLKKTKDPDEQARLKNIRMRVHSGKFQLPAYCPRH